jgi:hypothetical protein
LDKGGANVNASNQDLESAPQLVNYYQNNLPVVFFNGAINHKLVTDSISNFNQPVTFFAAQSFTIFSPVAPYYTTPPPAPLPPPENLILWLDASELSTLFVDNSSQTQSLIGSPVSLWLDKSQYRNDMAWVFNSPTNIYRAAPSGVVNNSKYDGKIPCITQISPFDSYATIGLNCFNSFTNSSPWTLFYVFSPSDMLKPNCLLSSKITGTEFNVQIISGQVSITVDNSQVLNVPANYSCVIVSTPVGVAYFIERTSSLIPRDIISIFAIVFDIGNIRLFNLGREVNKSFEKYNAPSPTNNFKLQIGSLLMSFLSEVQFWSVKLTEAQISVVTYNLCQKWNKECSFINVPPYSNPDYLFYFSNSTVT